jgi:signal transduction histidine kinase
LARQTFELGPLVHEILAGHARANPSRQYRATIEPDLIVDADPSLMRVAMENLLSNAWKYTADRPVAEIEMFATVRDSVPGFCLRDNGIGFSPGDAKRIFEPFVRLHSDHRYEGTGIGLTTVKRIIERHGGTISADSAPGFGTTFFFSLES